MNIKWHWIPNKSLGPIIIGSDITYYIQNFGAVYAACSRDWEWDMYELPEHDVNIDVTKKGKIDSILAYNEFIVDGKNIIGSNIIEVGHILSRITDEIGDPVEYDNGSIETPYEYFDLGLRIWVCEKVVVSASCMIDDDTDDT